MLPGEEVSIETRTRQLLDLLTKTNPCGFDDLFAGDRNRGDLVTSFLALLEMIRLKMIRVFQSSSFGPIRVYLRDRPADAPKPLGDLGHDSEHADTKRDSRKSSDDVAE